MRRFIFSLIPLSCIFWSGTASPVTCDPSQATGTAETAMSTTTSLPSTSSTTGPEVANSTLSTLSFVTASTCLCPGPVTTGVNTTIPISSVPPFSNTTLASNGSFFFPNATLTISIPPSGPEPTPNPPSNSAAAQLIRTVREKVLSDYNAYSTISCFKDGSSLSCGGPWLYGGDWNNNSLSGNIVASTVTEPAYTCSSDLTYLQPSRLTRVFYGFTADNITESLAGVAHATSMYAAGICSLNQTCAQLYNNATEQMYSDFQFYINSTFFTYMASNLPQNGSRAYCPKSISSSASLFYFATSHYDTGKEYFGIHNSAFLPGVAQAINGTVQEARLELGLMLANNARKFEGVWLNMIFFSFDPNNPLAARSTDEEEEEIYPGCPRRQYVIDGPCPGVIPPREYDMAGTVLPMKDRDMMERFGNSSATPTSTSLAVRQASGCDSAIAAIESRKNDLSKARGLLDAAIALVGDVPFVDSEILLLDPPLAIAAALVGMTAFGVLVAVAACDKFNTCDGLPPELVAIGNLFLQAAANVKAKDVIDAAVSKGIDEFESIVEDNVPEAKLIGALFDGVDKYYQLAEACCAVNCDSAICQQASLGCTLSWGDFWGGGLLNCGME